MKKLVHIVHCVDTEGPLNESIQATFKRIYTAFGIKFKPSKKTLKDIQLNKFKNIKNANEICKFVSPDRLNYKKNWKEINAMLTDMLSIGWRSKCKDDFGQGYLFTWFIVDHIGATKNPRKRALGLGTVFAKYISILKKTRSFKDEIGWHYHPPSYDNNLIKNSNNFSFFNYPFKILANRILKYKHFPSSFRPGFHTERPDINLFLEQWIPFDYGNQAVYRESNESKMQKDLANGRFGDWRFASKKWSPYHPCYFDYQKKGKMKRFITKCLNLNSRIREISPNEIEMAFKQAEKGEPTILAVTNHDEREMRPYILNFYKEIKKIKLKYPLVKIKNNTATRAMQECCKLILNKKLKFRIFWQKNTLNIVANKKIWGPQPFFCFKLKNNKEYWENLDKTNNGWSFTFDESTFLKNKIKKIGIAACDNAGNPTVKTF